jgi:hypothetical protein
MTPHTWTARVRAAGPDGVSVVLDGAAFDVGPQLTFQATEGPPTALQYFLGAFAADVLSGFRAAAARHRVQLHGIEAAASCELDNPLVHLGVVGEVGHPGIARIALTLYTSADEEAAVLDALWSETLARSPLVSTLQSAATLDLRLCVV